MKFAISALLLVATFITHSNVISARVIDEEVDNMMGDRDKIYLIHDEGMDEMHENFQLAGKESVLIDDAEIAPMCTPSVTTVSGSHAPSGQICSQQLILNENFDFFDMNLWRHEITMNGGGNYEFQMYINNRRNSYVSNGILHIRPTLTTDVIPDINNCHVVLESCTTPTGCSHICSPAHPAPPVQSARLLTQQSFSFKFGLVEIRAKLPTGDWLWPALWFMPTHSIYGTWPRSGEIDLMESRGNRDMVDWNGGHIGVEEFGSTLHFGTEWYNSAWWSANLLRRSLSGWGWNREFNLFQMQWAPGHISFSINNNWIGTFYAADGFFRRGQFTGFNPWTQGTIMAPFDAEFYFIMNIAVGGTNGFFPDVGNASGKPWLNASPNAIRDFWNGRNQWLPGWNLGVNTVLDASMQIDYVRVWAL